MRASIRKLAWAMPVSRDLMVMTGRGPHGIRYRGLFDQRLAAVLKQKGPESYDLINEDKANSLEREDEKLDSWIHPHDATLVETLSAIVSDGSSVVELGGSVGHFYYSWKYRTQPTARMSWTILELPEAVKLGEAVARRRCESTLVFLDSTRPDVAPDADIFLTAGTLQYMETDLPDYLRRLRLLPRHVLVHELPVRRGGDRWTLQDLTSCELPYRISDEVGLREGMAALGYEQMRAWHHDRPLHIPFRRDRTFKGYNGYHFERTKADTPPQ